MHWREGTFRYSHLIDRRVAALFLTWRVEYQGSFQRLSCRLTCIHKMLVSHIQDPADERQDGGGEENCPLVLRRQVECNSERSKRGHVSSKDLLSPRDKYTPSLAQFRVKYLEIIALSLLRCHPCNCFRPRDGTHW